MKFFSRLACLKNLDRNQGPYLQAPAEMVHRNGGPGRGSAQDQNAH